MWSFDACFYHKQHIAHIISNLHYPHFAFTLRAPLEFVLNGMASGSENLGKRPAIAVHRLVSRFDRKGN